MTAAPGHSEKTRAIEQELRLERDKLRAIIDNLKIGIGITDAAGATLSLNTEGLRIHGFASEAEMFADLGRYMEEFELRYPDGRLMPPEEWPAMRAMRLEYVQDYEVTLIRRGATPKYITYSVVPIYDDDAQVVLHVYNMVDLTERKRMEDELHQANVELESRIRERTRQLRTLAAESSLNLERRHREIARALHDNLGPLLALAKLQLGQLGSSLSDPAQRAEIDAITTNLCAGIEFSRSLTFDLSPPILDGLSFFSALRWLGEHFLEQNAILVDACEIGEALPLADNLSMTLFNITRELLINVVKHAAADRAVLELEWQPAELRLTIGDNGNGFDVQQQKQHAVDNHSYGLISVREQLAYINGQMVLESAPQQGTRIEIRVPLPPAEEIRD